MTFANDQSAETFLIKKLDALQSEGVNVPGAR